MNTIYYTKPQNLDLVQILVAAEFIGESPQLVEINKKYDPLILVTSEGTINQPTAILLYVCDQKLNGKSRDQTISIYSWFQHFNTNLAPVLKQLYGQICKQRPASKQKFNYCCKQLERQLEGLNNHLKLRSFFVGDAITSFDISLATQLETAFKKLINQETRKKLGNLTRWFTYIRSTLPFIKILNEIQLCGKESFKVVQDGVSQVKQKCAKQVEIKEQ